MPDLWFDADADAALSRMERDPANRGLVVAIRRILHQLETDPGARSVRTIRFQDPPLWCVVVPHREEDWAVLWGPHPVDTNAVVIHYIGPSSFL